MKRKVVLGLMVLTFSIVAVSCGKVGEDAKESQSAQSTQNTQSQVSSGSQMDETQVDEDAQNNEVVTLENGVRAQWAGDMDLAGIQVFDLDSSEDSTRILFTADEEVPSFQVLALEVDSVDDDGKITYTTSKRYESGLTKGSSLVIGLAFAGDTPNYGISYQDAEGNVKQYSINISGENGELLLEEF